MDPFDAPDLQHVKSRLSAKAWQQRVAKAKEAEKVLQQILALVDEGVALNTAIPPVVLPSRRS